MNKLTWRTLGEFKQKQVVKTVRPHDLVFFCENIPVSMEIYIFSKRKKEGGQGGVNCPKISVLKNIYQFCFLGKSI